jgi:hypothetical protein
MFVVHGQQRAQGEILGSPYQRPVLRQRPVQPWLISFFFPFAFEGLIEGAQIR